MAKSLEGREGISVASAGSYRRHLAVYVAPRCYLYVLNREHPVHLRVDANLVLNRAFSTVVADAQFSALGMVLLSTLSSLTKAAGIDYQDMNCQPPSTKGLAKERERKDDTNNNNNHVLRPGKEDFGQVVHREHTSACNHGPEPMTKDLQKAKTKAPKPKKPKKNAIDDLFEGLI